MRGAAGEKAPPGKEKGGHRVKLDGFVSFVEDMPAMWPVNILFLGRKRIKKNGYPS